MSASVEGPGPGDWFCFVTADGRRAGGQIIAVEDGAVAVCVCGAVWDCQPGVLDLSQEPLALDHLVLPRARLAELAWVGPGTPSPAGVAAHARWAAGPRAVVDAPLAALMAALLLD